MFHRRSAYGKVERFISGYLRMTDSNDILFLRQDLEKHWRQIDDIFSHVRDLEGEVFRQKEGRRTFRYLLQEQPYFIKYHGGIGWKEIARTLLKFRWPVLGARNEWQAIHCLEKTGIVTMTLAGYGARGLNPARQESFVITDELRNTMSLEHLGRQWLDRPPAFPDKIRLIHRLADISRDMHAAGMNHRDYYLCHFLTDVAFGEDSHFDDSCPLYLIDLHRAQLRRQVPQRWLRKDLAGLYFSALEVPLTRRDLLRFIRRYRQAPLRDILSTEQRFWQKVAQQARALYAKTRRPTRL